MTIVVSELCHGDTACDQMRSDMRSAEAGKLMDMVALLRLMLALETGVCQSCRRLVRRPNKERQA